MTRMSEAAGAVGGSSVTVEDDDNESATRTSSDQVTPCLLLLYSMYCTGVDLGFVVWGVGTIWY